MARAYIGLGSNLDDPAARIIEARERIAALPETQLLSSSRLYQSPPWGLLEQPDFINAVLLVDTQLAPSALLQQLLEIERQMGRTRALRWGPRRIDLDLLHIEGVCSADEALQLPHPRLHERAFVLRPWLELDPAAEVPGLGRLGDWANKVDCSTLEPLP